MGGIIRRSNDVFSTSVDDTLLMMSVDKGLFFGTNEIGGRIWELLERPTTEAAVMERLLEEFEVTPEVCAGEVSAFLAALRERGLLADEG